MFSLSVRGFLLAYWFLQSKTARQTTSKPKRKATLEVQQKKAKASPSKVKVCAAILRSSNG